MASEVKFNLGIELRDLKYPDIRVLLGVKFNSRSIQVKKSSLSSLETEEVDHPGEVLLVAVLGGDAVVGGDDGAVAGAGGRHRPALRQQVARYGRLLHIGRKAVRGQQQDQCDHQCDQDQCDQCDTCRPANHPLTQSSHWMKYVVNLIKKKDFLLDFEIGSDLHMLFIP